MQTNSLLQINAKSLKIYVTNIATSKILSIFRIPDTMRFRFCVIFVNQSFTRSIPTAREFDQDRERHLLAVEKNFSAPRVGDRHWRREKTANIKDKGVP